MDGLDYWRLCDQLDIVQAALLVCGHDPSVDQNYVENRTSDKRPPGYETSKTAISNALKKGLMEGQLIPRYYDMDDNRYGEIENSIDLRESRIEVESLRSWLLDRGFHTGFFFPTATGAPDYLDPDHPRYAPKLTHDPLRTLAEVYERPAGSLAASEFTACPQTGLVADHPAREADQDRREGRATWPLCHRSARGSRYLQISVR